MPRKSSKARGAAAPRLVLKTAAPNPSPTTVFSQAAAAAAEALEGLHVVGAPPEPPPPESETEHEQPEPEAPASPQPPPAEASTSGRATEGGSLEEAVTKLHELAEVGREEVELTEEEVRTNDERQEHEETDEENSDVTKRILNKIRASCAAPEVNFSSVLQDVKQEIARIEQEIVYCTATDVEVIPEQNLFEKFEKYVRDNEAEKNALWRLVKAQDLLMDIKEVLQHASESRKKDKSSGRQSQLEQEITDLKALRKQLHNELQDLKGAVRVFIRICPLNGQPGEAFSKDLEDDRLIHIRNKVLGSRTIIFDKVFDANASQNAIFEEISPLVKSALDGYKVCVFAYGQTGSGKTYTMLGHSLLGDTSLGVIPRTAQLIWAEDSEFLIKISAFEVYNESIFDLLAPTARSKVQVNHNEAISYVSGLTYIEISKKEEFSKAVLRIVNKRSIGETKMNNASSRSHLIFQLDILKANEEIGSICLVDLAGCGNSSKAETKGERKIEGNHINKSLSTLRRVLNSIANKQKGYINFRDSKLTEALEPYLKGDAKVALIATLSQEKDDERDTVSTIDFAENVKSCILNNLLSPTSNMKTISKMRPHLETPNPAGIPAFSPSWHHPADFGPGPNFPRVWKLIRRGSSPRSPHIPRGKPSPPLESRRRFPGVTQASGRPPERRGRGRIQAPPVASASPSSLASFAPLPPRSLSEGDDPSDEGAVVLRGLPNQDPPPLRLPILRRLLVLRRLQHLLLFQERPLLHTAPTLPH